MFPNVDAFIDECANQITRFAERQGCSVISTLEWEIGKYIVAKYHATMEPTSHESNQNRVQASSIEF